MFTNGSQPAHRRVSSVMLDEHCQHLKRVAENDRAGVPSWRPTRLFGAACGARSPLVVAFKTSLKHALRHNLVNALDASSLHGVTCSFSIPCIETWSRSRRSNSPSTQNMLRVCQCDLCHVRSPRACLLPLGCVQGLLPYLLVTLLYLSRVPAMHKRHDR